MVAAWPKRLDEELADAGASLPPIGAKRLYCGFLPPEFASDLLLEYCPRLKPDPAPATYVGLAKSGLALGGPPVFGGDVKPF